MKNTIEFACQIGTTNADAALGLEIWLDAVKIYNNNHVSVSEIFRYAFPDTVGNHELQFVMKNKLPQHTKIDETGNIVEDARLVINNLEFEEIDLTQLFNDCAVYTHNVNDTQPETKDQFFGEMGCNGTVTLQFTTPMYLWLLENM